MRHHIRSTPADFFAVTTHVTLPPLLLPTYLHLCYLAHPSRYLHAVDGSPPTFQRPCPSPRFQDNYSATTYTSSRAEMRLANTSHRRNIESGTPHGSGGISACKIQGTSEHEARQGTQSTPLQPTMRKILPAVWGKGIKG